MALEHKTLSFFERKEACNTLKETYPKLATFLDQTCAALFCWELPDFGPRLVTLDNIEAFERLCAEVQGNVDRITDTEAARAIYGSYEALQLVMQLRTLSRKKYYKGVVSTNGKITSVQFGSKLSPEEDKFLEENLACLKGLLASSQYNSL